jgi:toxin ParE1/3/4
MREQCNLQVRHADGVGAFGIEQAENYSAGLEAAFEFIADHPQGTRERREINPPVSVHPYKSHAMIYLIEGGDALILRVRHGRED